MDLRSSSRIGVFGTSQNATRLNVSITSDSDKANTTSRLKETKGDQTSVTGSSTEVSTLLIASNSKSFVDIASAAVSSIASLREKQSDLAYEAKNTADPTRQTTLNTELSNLQTEIQRVYNAATFNGQNVLQGNTSVVSSDRLDLNEVVSSANLSTLATNPNVSLSGQTNASTAYDTLTGYVAAAYSAVAGIGAAASKADTTLSEAVSKDQAARQISPTKISEIEVAQKVADNVSEKIAASADPNKGEKALVDSISNLNPDRVAALLSEDS